MIVRIDPITAIVSNSVQGLNYASRHLTATQMCSLELKGAVSRY